VAKKTAKKAGPGGPVLDERARVVLLCGKESFLRSYYTRLLREKLEAAHGGVDVIRLDGQSASIGDAIEECQSFGLMASHRMVIVDSADQMVKESARASMERYAQHPSDSATLVLRCEKWNSGKLDAMIEAVGAIVPCDEIEPDKAVNWVVARASKRHAVTFERRAAMALVDRVGVDLTRLDTEIAKLSAGLGAGSGEGESVTVERVESMVERTREEKVWEIQSALLLGTPEQALGMLREMLEISRHDPVLISFACMDLARKVHAVAVGLDRGDAMRSLAGSLKIWPMGAQAPIERMARAIGPARAARMLGRAVETDIALKSGLGDQVRQLERLTIEFTGV